MFPLKMNFPSSHRLDQHLLGEALFFKHMPYWFNCHNIHSHTYAHAHTHTRTHRQPQENSEANAANTHIVWLMLVVVVVVVVVTGQRQSYFEK